MDFLNQLLDSSQVPLLTAFLLGLLTAISPCPLATNITAIGFISKGMQNRHRVLWSGILYALGRTLAYSVLGALLIYIIRKGADTFDLQQMVSKWGEIVIGPALIVIGVLMLVGEFVDLGGKFGFQAGRWSERLNGTVGAFILGILFALAFCPSSGLLYFGMLIPMSATASGGYLLPVVYAIATSLPVLIVAWILAFSIKSLSTFMGKVTVFQRWFNRLVAVLFVGVGLLCIRRGAAEGGDGNRCQRGHQRCLELVREAEFHNGYSVLVLCFSLVRFHCADTLRATRSRMSLQYSQYCRHPPTTLFLYLQSLKWFQRMGERMFRKS